MALNQFDGLPYWIDDDLIDKKAHRMETSPGGCSCGTMPACPADWDYHAVAEAFDNHMHDVQVRTRAAMS